MNITFFKTVLRKEALSCYNDVLHSLKNQPFIEKNTDIINDILEFELNQSLGKKAYKSVMYSNISEAQLKVLKSLVDDYKMRIKKSVFSSIKNTN